MVGSRLFRRLPFDSLDADVPAQFPFTLRRHGGQLLSGYRKATLGFLSHYRTYISSRL
jgi:hypothetical protein